MADKSSVTVSSTVQVQPATMTAQQQLAHAKAELAKVKAQKAALTKETGALSKRHSELEATLKTEVAKLRKLKARKIGAFIGLNSKELELHHQVLRLSEHVKAETLKRLAVTSA